LAVSRESTELRFVTPETIDDVAISPPVRLRIRHYLDKRSEPAVT
jgi:hypothetical protein